MLRHQLPVRVQLTLDLMAIVRSGLTFHQDDHANLIASLVLLCLPELELRSTGIRQAAAQRCTAVSRLRVRGKSGRAQ
jgi:hypothetical protein